MNCEKWEKSGMLMEGFFFFFFCGLNVVIVD